MMQLFNILLISLSVATILLTLVSYILYKARQLPRSSQQRQETRKIEGAFFRRYTPGEVRTESSPTAEAAHPVFVWKKIPQTTGVFFLIVASAIFGALLVQTLWLRMHNGDLLTEDQRKALMADGLLRRYKLGQIPTEHMMDEYIFPEEKARLEALLGKLRGKKIVLFQSPGNLKAERGRHIEALANWTAFLQDNEIPFQNVRDLPSIKAGTELLILPGALFLSPTERNAITTLLGRGISILTTGPIGVGEGDPDSDASFWRERTFGIRLILNPMSANLYPALFVGGTPPWWDIPPGLDAPWFPEDIDYKAVAISGTTAMYEGDYKGALNGIEGYANITEVTRAQFIQGKGARTGWLANDPGKLGTELTEAERYYVRAALIHSLAWTAGVPMARISSWRRGSQSAMSVWVDTEFKFENIDGMADLYKAQGFPATYFVVSNLFRLHPSMMDHMTPEMEIESHSENHQPFNLQPLALQFDRIQTSRLEIEPISRKPVVAFRPPTEKYNVDTVNAVLQNGMVYLTGERAFMRYSPAWIASGKLLFFPRLLNDDISLKQAGLLDDPDDFLSTVTNECDFVGKLHGIYLLGLHTQNFEPGPNLDNLAKVFGALNERKYWKANFMELYQWAKGRLGLTAELIPGETAGKYRLVVTNDGDTAWGDFGIELDTGKPERLKLPDRSLASLAPGVNLVKETGYSRLMIDRINPKDTLTFDLETEQ